MISDALTPNIPHVQQDASTVSKPTQNDMDKEAFLKMLITQLRNQNPLNPMEGKEFASQLAQYSQVEQLTEMNKQLSHQTANDGEYLQALRRNRATSLLGQSVEAGAQGINFDEGGEVPLSFTLPESVEGARLMVTGSDGLPVLAHDMGALDAGSHAVTWNGTRATGEPAPSGVYSFHVEYGEGDNVQSQRAAINGPVDRVRMDEDDILLQVGGATIDLGSVTGMSTGQ